MLRIWDVYPWSKIRFSIPDPGYEFFHLGSRIRIYSIPDPGSASKNLSILAQKIVSKLSEIWSGFHPGSGSRIRIMIFYPSRVPGSKRHWIPVPGSASLFKSPHKIRTRFGVSLNDKPVPVWVSRASKWIWILINDFDDQQLKKIYGNFLYSFC